MPYLNSVTIMGHLVTDPDLRHLASGDAVASLRIAVNYTRADDKTRKGEVFDCDLWGGWATNLTRTAKKGSLVVVDGRLAEDRWVDAKTNQTRSRVKIVARRAFHVVAQYAEPRDTGEQGPGEAQTAPEPGEARAPSPF